MTASRLGSEPHGLDLYVSRTDEFIAPIHFQHSSCIASSKRRFASGVRFGEFRYDIQGIRALAVLSVVIFHAFPSLLTGGFVGVDIFFVISGYLITNSITKDIELQRFSLKEFYRRRIRRLFPAMALVLAACIVAGYIFFDPQQLRGLSQSVVATMLFVSNVYFMKTTGYFDGASDAKPLLHTWSLSVEEQFYILFPIFMFFLFRYFRRGALGSMVLLTILCLILSEAIVRLRPEWGYFFTPARAFELLIGATVSLMVPRFRLTAWPKAMEALAALGLALMIVPMVVYSNKTAFPGIAAAVPCLGTALVLFVGGTSTSTLVGRVLSTGPCQFFGNLSYSLYLWHWPLLAFPRAVLGLELEPWVASLSVVAAILISAASYRWVEVPFIRPGYPRLPYLTVGTGMIAAFCAVGIAGHALNGLPMRFSPEARALFAATDDANPRRAQCHNGTEANIPYDRNCVFGAEGVAADVVVWGDSHGAELAYALGEIAPAAGHKVMQITASACPPALNTARAGRPSCQAHNARTLTALVADRNVRTVVLVAYYQVLRKEKGFDTGFEDVVRDLRKAGKNVVIVLPIPVYDFDVPSVLGSVQERGGDPSTIGVRQAEFDASVADTRTFLTDLAARYGARIFDPAALFCDGALCRVYRPAVGVLYFNENHISLTAARHLSAPLLQTLSGTVSAAAGSPPPQ
nr:acyltransferase family protein [Ancylobacter gelatini]